MTDAKTFRPTCFTCTAFVIDGDKSYCEENNFEDEPLQKAKTFEPSLFDCIEYEQEPK